MAHAPADLIRLGVLGVIRADAPVRQSDRIRPGAHPGGDPK
jgi:hypothetical protein